MQVIVFDIETKTDDEYCARPEFVEAVKAACQAPRNWKDPVKIEEEVRRQFEERQSKLCLSPRTGRIVAISVAELFKGDIATFYGDDEAAVLQEFREWLPPHRAVMAGFYVRQFDIPFVAVRAVKLGVQLPLWWPQPKDWRYIADAADLLTEGKLADWLDCFGLPEKTAHGSDVADMTLDQVAEYCEADVERERKLLQRMARVLPPIRDNMHIRVSSDERPDVGEAWARFRDLLNRRSPSKSLFTRANRVVNALPIHVPAELDGYWKNDLMAIRGCGAGTAELIRATALEYLKGNGR